MAIRTTWVLVVGLAAGAAWAGDAPPATGPARVPALIAQLGDADYAAREEAMQRLVEVGKAALPALRAAAKSEDPEVRNRVEQLLKRFERRAVPGKSSTGKLVARDLKVTEGPEGRTVEVTEEFRTVKITLNEEGLEMSVTGDLNGKQATEVFRAATPEELRKENPEAFAVYAYQMSVIGGNGDWVMRGGPNGAIVVNPGLRRAVGDDVDLVRLKLEEAMAKAEVPDGQRDRVRAQVLRMDEARAMDGQADAETKVQQFLEQSDELRKIIGELKLPDPGDLLPPPANARLGVAISEGGVGEGMGLTITKVVAGARGQTLGLQFGDVIQKVNGQDVRTVQELRQALVKAAAAGPLKLEGMRGGEALRLEDRPAKPATRP